MSPTTQLILTIFGYFAAGFILLAACAFVYERYYTRKLAKQRMEHYNYLNAYRRRKNNT